MSDDGPSVTEVWGVTAVLGVGLVYLMWWIIKITFWVCVGIGWLIWMGCSALYEWYQDSQSK